ncbi:MAG: hypothetical protein CL693_06635 [Cellvibrionaceae bacterium]|nr:hypothetical protein [Cellvibrionaceae bacterium]
MLSGDILAFWFEELTPQQHFVKDLELDGLIKQRFLPLLESAMQSELWSWRETINGRLAEIILLDQFSRNIYRDHPLSFVSDPLALCLAQEAVASGGDQQLEPDQRAFLYMPYMHSESAAVQAQATQLFSQKGMERNFQFALKHREIIDQFGRFPHRNEILGRQSTPAEIEFLQQPGSSF